jgi:hypothetical protein
MSGIMIERKETLYDVLGVSRDAKVTDVTRAYNRLRKEATRDDAIPDLKREAKLKEAYDTLSDPDRREAYDRSLVAPDRKHASRLRGIAIGALGVALAAGWLFFMKSPSTPTVKARASEEILNDIAISIAKVQSIDLSGQATNVGDAFAIGENVLVSACAGVAPTAQLVVLIPPRQVPARILSVDDEIGLCRLVAQGTGSRPILRSTAEVKVGDLVYAAKVKEGGKVALEQSLVKLVALEPKGKVIEAGAHATAGTPLLDAQGQLLAVATKTGGRYVSVPPAWITEALEPFKEEKAPTAPPAPEPQQAGTQPTAPGTQPQPNEDALKHITPEQRARLEKAYRPPPDTKDDWMK